MTNPSTSEFVVIIGGGIIGSSIAYFLRELGFKGQVSVIEQDPTYAYSSTALSAASIRTQFGCPVNIHMSLYGADFFRSIKRRFGQEADIGFVERGYLILGAPEVAADRRAGVAMQSREGAAVSALDLEETLRRFPWLNTDGLAIATFGESNEGWFDAWSLLQLMRSGASARDVTFIHDQARELVCERGRVTGVKLENGRILAADWCVNAAGAAAAKLVRSIGINLPVEARKRTVFSCRAPLDGNLVPMVFDTSGAWIRPEGEGFICGIAPADDDDLDAAGDFEPHHHLLEDVLWPALAHRIPMLERLRVERCWAGHYEVNTLDHNAIIGPDDEIENLVYCNGFSGHGVMHAPAAGRGVAEWINHGAYQTLDLTPLGYDRIRRMTPLHETLVY